MADPVKGGGDPVKIPTPTPTPKPNPITGAPPVITPIPPIINSMIATGLWNVGTGSNPAAYTPLTTLPIGGADATKGNVAGLVGYVGPLLSSPLQGNPPPISCGVLGQGSDNCPGVVGTNGALTITDPDAGGDGVFGFGSVNGVHGISTSGTGVGGNSTSGDGVFGKTTTGVAVHGQSLGSGAAGKFEGAVQVTGNITASGNVTANDIMLSGADCAEEFDVRDGEASQPGTIMVIDDEGTLRQSQRPYDRRVAGVVSGAGEYKPAIVLDRRASSAGRASLALVGKVFCKVDADPAPIAVGDLLTTSERPGFGMKAADPAQAFGAVIGKALKPLREGQGLIPIIVSLQ
jgi:hypothetical protein